MPRYPDIAPTIAAMQASVYSSLVDRVSRQDGEVYPFHVGDTWMEPAEGTRMENLTVAEHPGMHRYAPVQGLPALLDAVVERTRERTGAATERGDVLIAAGATGALGAAVGALVEPGDEVLILAPYWPLIEGIVRSFRGRPVAVPFFGEVDSPEAAVEAVSALAGDRTVAIYWNTPNNPSGRLMEASWVEALCHWAMANDLWILADEVYEETLFEGVQPYARPLAPEHTISIHSFSKCFGMAGNRCGWAVGPGAMMKELRKVSTHTFYSTPTASQLAALRALAGPGDEWAAAARLRYAEIGRRAAARLGVEAPKGSTFLFFDVADHLTENGLLGWLERCADAGLLLAPGPSFGPYPTHVRLCFTATPPEVTARGVEKLAAILERAPARPE